MSTLTITRAMTRKVAMKPRQATISETQKAAGKLKNETDEAHMADMHYYKYKLCTC